MHELVREGDVITISAPATIPTHSGCRGDLLIAGGIGITPLTVCMAERLYVLSCLSPSLLHAFGGTHSVQERIQQAGYAAHVRLHLTTARSSRSSICPRCCTPRRESTSTPAAPRVLWTLCCPMRAAAAGLGPASLQFFSAAPRSWPPTEASSQAFQLGRTIRVAADATVTSALAVEGILVPTSCEQGVCGTCLTHALEGNRPSGHVPDAAGAVRERPVPALLFPLQSACASSGPLRPTTRLRRVGRKPEREVDRMPKAASEILAPSAHASPPLLQAWLFQDVRSMPPPQADRTRSWGACPGRWAIADLSHRVQRKRPAARQPSQGQPHHRSPAHWLLR